MKRNVYLKMTSLEEARQRFRQAFDWGKVLSEESRAAADALGRVLAEPCFARFSSPGYNAAAMDGFAVAARDTFGASEEQPLLLRIGQQAFAVNTGNPLPDRTDAVVMIEHVHQPGPDQLELRAAAFPWQHVRRIGEDIVAGEMVLPHYHRLTATDVAALLAAGVFRVQLLTLPRVAVICTGSELTSWQQAEQTPPPPGAIIESNSHLLAGLVREQRCLAEVLPPQPDDPAALQSALEHAVRSSADLVIINAGASAGSADHTASVVGKLGEVLVHGVTAMPGKPTLLGRVQGKPVVGAPGYPVSAWVCFDQFIAPALAWMQGQDPPARQQLTALPSRQLPSRLGQEEFVRVHLGRVGEQVVATPLKRGAGAITSLTQADGILRIPRSSEGVEQASPVTAELLRGARSADHTLIMVGSHDITIDCLANRLRAHTPQVKLSASNLGSQAGLVALGHGRSHLGGTHLLDPESGEYNVPYLKRLLPETPVQLVTLAHRQQGFMVPRGNPRGIRGLEDLAGGEIKLVNRQRGSGTRVLLDHQLKLQQIPQSAINGYAQEEFTHLGVAVQVASGGADVGLGILAAARALELDFIPLCQERYDLCIPLAFIDDPRMQALLQVLRSPAFNKEVQELGGYDVEQMGRVAWRSE